MAYVYYLDGIDLIFRMKKVDCTSLLRRGAS